MSLPNDDTAPTAPLSFQTPPWEQRAIGVALAVYFVVQFNAILHHGTWGQDFISHLRFTGLAYQNPHKFWTTYIEGQNNPPLFHMFCAAVFWATRHVHSLEVISIITALFHAGALLLLHRLGLRMIGSPVMRVAAFVFLAFLPAAMIHAVVIAADGVATPTTVLLMYTLVRVAEAGRQGWRRFIPWCVAALGALQLAVLIKFTSVSLVPAAAVVIGAAWWARCFDGRRAAVALLVVVAVPALVGFATYRQYRAQQKGNLGVNMANDPFDADMNIRCILFPRRADLRLLSAPPYDAPSEFVFDGVRQYEIAVKQRYSYIGLLHLAVFTDILNVYQYDPHDLYIGTRHANQQHRMALAVKTALPFTFCAVLAVPWMLGRSLWRVLVRRDAAALPVLGVLTVSFAFFLIIVVFIPFTAALSGGYWLPRLIIPSLLGFFLVTFALLDRTPVGTTKVGRAVCLAAVLFQAGLSVSFLWPWGVNGPGAPSLPELVGSEMTVRATLEARFAPQPAGTSDPLLTVGRWGVAWYVFARHDGRGNARIAFNQWGHPEVPESEPIAIDPTRTYRIEIEADPPAHRLVVRVDGSEVLRTDTISPMPVFRDEVHAFKNPAGGGLAAETFSGTVVSSHAAVHHGKRWGPRPAPANAAMRK